MNRRIWLKIENVFENEMIFSKIMLFDQKSSVFCSTFPNANKMLRAKTLISMKMQWFSNYLDGLVFRVTIHLFGDAVFLKWRRKGGPLNKNGQLQWFLLHRVVKNNLLCKYIEWVTMRINGLQHNVNHSNFNIIKGYWIEFGEGKKPKMHWKED